MALKDLSFGTPDRFNVLIEIERGSRNKYEYDEKLDQLKLNWVFQNGFSFPFNYGLIPETLGGDGDQLDVFVLTANPITPGTLVECRAIGVIELLDRGEEDNKILAVPLKDPALANLKSWQDWPEDLRPLFIDFYTELGRQKNKLIEIKGFYDDKRAKAELIKAHQDYLARAKK